MLLSSWVGNGIFLETQLIFEDGLSFDGRLLKIIGFCNQCFGKLYALLK